MKIFWRTPVRMRLAMVAISFMLGLGYVTRYSGLDAVLGQEAFVQAELRVAHGLREREAR
jgi:L-lactate permease